MTGEAPWSCISVGSSVLVEMPSRWYLGVVVSRNSVNFELTESICGHDLGDLGQFLDGVISNSTELTPLPRNIFLSLSSLDSAQEYPLAMLKAVRKRTHTVE